MVETKRVYIYKKDMERIMEWGKFNMIRGDIESPNFKVNFPYFLTKMLDKLDDQQSKNVKSDLNSKKRSIYGNVPMLEQE